MEVEMKTTDTQLKAALAKMLPEKIGYLHSLYWLDRDNFPSNEVLDTELLHVCWLVEEALTLTELTDLGCELACLIAPPNHTAAPHWGQLSHASWQQRAVALAKVKGIEL